MEKKYYWFLEVLKCTDFKYLEFLIEIFKW